MFKVTFYETEAGNEVVADFIRGLPKGDRKVVGEDLMTLQLGFPMGMPMCRHVRSQVWELRSSLPSKRETRLLYFFESTTQQLVVLHGFIKTTRTTPKAAIELAEKRKKELE